MRSGSASWLNAIRSWTLTPVLAAILVRVSPATTVYVRAVAAASITSTSCSRLGIRPTSVVSASLRRKERRPGGRTDTGT
jgi:hypothetical protein